MGQSANRSTDAVTWVLDWNHLALRWVEWFVNVVQANRLRTMESIELENDTFLSKTCSCWSNTACCCEINFSVWFDSTNLKDCPIHITHEAIAQFLCHVAEVEVVVSNLACIHMLTESWVSGVRCAIADSMFIRKDTVATLTSGSTCENTNLIRATCLVLSMCNFSNLCCDSLGCSCWSETTEGNVIAVLHQCSCLSSCDSCKRHNLRI